MSNIISSSGEIITFYSYKGGTGRSMALANIACLFAKKVEESQKVLIIDWDLEAPGLHQFFHGQFGDSNEDLPAEQPGLIDLFYEIKARLDAADYGDNISDNFFDELGIQNYIASTNVPSLLMMPAGKFDDGLYSVRVNEFDWAEFFDSHPLAFIQLAQYLRKTYRYTLIDSRTGYTDISGICTSIMPEKLVVAFTPNRQSLTGAIELIRRATEYRKQSDDLRQLMVFPLPSRIENAENKLQKEWRFGEQKNKIEGYQAKFESILKNTYNLETCDLTNYFDEIQIQYVPKYSYGEDLSVLSERAEDRLSVARSFEGFAEKITGTKRPWEKDTTFIPKSVQIQQDEAGVERPQISRAQIIATLLLLGFVGVIAVSLLNTSSPTIYFISFTLWLLFGAFVDVFKVILATFGNTTSKLTETLKDISHVGRVRILDIDVSKIDFLIIKDISRVFGQIKNSLLSWSTNFLRQVIEPSHDIDSDEQSRPLKSERNEDTYLLSNENNFGSIFNSRSEYQYAGQQIIGALIGFVALLAFLYADAAQGAQTLSFLYPSGVIPDFLSNITIPVILASAGSALILGIFIGDILGLTHFGLFTKNTPRYFLWIISINLVFSILLSVIIALNRIGLTGTDNLLTSATNIAQSIVILPMLITTTTLLFRGLYGVYVVLAAILSLLSIPFAIFELSIRVLSDLLRLGTIGGNFIVTRTVWLILGTLELVFLILDLVFNGFFAALTYLLVAIFFLPNLLFRIVLRVFMQESFYEEFLVNLLSTSLQLDVNENKSKKAKY